MITFIIMGIIVLIGIILAFKDNDAELFAIGLTTAVVALLISIMGVSTWYRPNESTTEYKLTKIESTNSFVNVADESYIFNLDGETVVVDSDEVEIKPLQSGEPSVEVTKSPTTVNSVAIEFGKGTSYVIYLPSENINVID